MLVPNQSKLGIYLDAHENAAWQSYNVRITLPQPVWAWIDTLKSIELNQIRKGLHKGSYTTLTHYFLNFYRSWYYERFIQLALEGKVRKEDIGHVCYLKWFDFTKAYADQWAIMPDLLITKRIHWYVNPSNSTLINRSSDVIFQDCPIAYSLIGVPSCIAALWIWAYMHYGIND